MSTSATSVASTSSKSKPKTSASLSKTTDVKTEPVVILEEEQEAEGTVPEGQEEDFPEIVAVPGRKQKGKPMLFKTADMKGKLLNLWMDLQQCAREFLNPGTPKIVGRWNDVYGHFTKINFQKTQLFLAEVQWKIIVKALQQLEGHRRTAIVARGLPNTCAFWRLMNDYAISAMGGRFDLRLLELADGGTLRLARFVRDMVSWHFGVEELVVAALDMGNKGRAACQGGRMNFGKYQSLEYYLGTNLYDPAVDIGFVECSCTPDIVERLKNCPNTQTVGNKIRRWRTE